MGKTVSYTLGSISALMYLGLGIACLVIWYSNPIINCGFTGNPLPLGHWVQGSGIGYSIYGGCCAFAAIIALSIVGIIPLLLVMFFGGIFVFIWTIIGAVVLWRDGMDCLSANYSLWAVAMATVISPLGLTVIYCLFGKAMNKERDED